MGGRDHIAFNDGSDGDQAPLRGPEGGHASDASSSLVFQVSAVNGRSRRENHETKTNLVFHKSFPLIWFP